MAWTYTGDPANSDRDAIRFLIGDTDASDPLLDDAEIDYLHAAAGASVYQGAHDACHALAAKFTRMATSKSVGDLSVTFQDRAAAYLSLSEQIMQLAARRDLPTPWIKPDAIRQGRDRTTSTGTELAVGTMDNRRFVP